MSNDNKAIKEGFGAIDETAEDLVSKGGSGTGFFGLNTGMVSKLEVVNDAGEGGSPGFAIDVTFVTKEKEFRGRFYDITRVFGKNREIIEESHKDYIDKYNKELSQLKASITHVIKTFGVTGEKINNALATPPNSFEEWAKIMVGLVPDNYSTMEIDAFLEYQWKISEGQDRTWTQLPKNMKGGYFLCKSIEPQGRWNEQKTWNEEGKVKRGLRYVDDRDNVHIFVRNENFMNSNKANMQSLKEENVATENAPIDSSNSTW